MKNIKIKFNNLTLYFLLIALLSGYIKNALIILFIVLFHELGHVFICLLFKYKINVIEIFPFGGMTKVDKLLNTKISKDLLIAFGGVFFQVVIHILCITGFINEPLVYNYNLSIMIFNLLPIIPLDGSKILFEIINYKFSYKTSLWLYSVISFIFIIVYFLFDYHYELNNYMIIILFVYKTVEVLKYKNVIHNKFILERLLYDIEYNKIENYNQEINNYQKNRKYYYLIENNIVSEKEYLKQYFQK